MGTARRGGQIQLAGLQTMRGKAEEVDRVKYHWAWWQGESRLRDKIGKRGCPR